MMTKGWFNSKVAETRRLLPDGYTVTPGAFDRDLGGVILINDDCGNRIGMIDVPDEGINYTAFHKDKVVARVEFIDEAVYAITEAGMPNRRKTKVRKKKRVRKNAVDDLMKTLFGPR